MQGSFLLPILFSLQYVVVYSVLPSLVVKKIDRTLIAQKRQDTMDMCRIFTEENHKSHHSHAPKIIKSYAPIKNRYKRDVIEEIHNKDENIRYKRDTEDAHDHGKVNIDMSEDSLKEIHRFKRATMMYAVNPALNPADTRRVENIVDKLYDELEEKGQRVTYRQVQTDSIKVPRNKTFPSRRFDFAPASLGFGTQDLKTPPEPVDTPFPSKARWKQGIVPYFIDSKTYDAHLSELIMKAFDYVEKATCIRLQRLREKPTDKLSLEHLPWLYISNPTGIRQCVHSNEKRRINGVQMTVFGYDCMSLGDIVHEVMHILGYSHEHLRSDRDQHISVLWDNIKPGYKKYFDLNIEGSEYDLESLPYDYASILHYPPRAFSKNGKVTILTEPGIKIGQREGLSEIDVEKIALIYSNECVSRNKQYLLETCPSVVKSVVVPPNVSYDEINDYFKERLWPYGIVNYRFRDKMEFSIEERENILAVFQHIEQETCLQFRDVAAEDDDEEAGDSANDPYDGTITVTPQPTSVTETNPSPEDGQQQSDSSEDTKPHTIDPPITEHNTDDENSDENTPKPTLIIEPIESTIILEVTTESPDSQNTKITEPVSSSIESDQEKVPKQDAIITELDQTTDSIEHILGPGKKAEIVITQPKTIQRLGNFDEDIKDNEISGEKNKVFGGRNKLNDINNMNITMKKALLKIAKQRNGNKRYRRDTRRPQTRRHANAILVLRRTPDPTCQCPKPGSPDGDKMLDISAGCFNSVNDLLHFFVHLLGLEHQHNMHDRDNYLHIDWDNLSPDVSQELKDKLPVAASVGFAYDYQSVMHFPWLQIKNGKSNIMYPIWNDGWAMGHWQGLSSVDVLKLKRLYLDQCMQRNIMEKQDH